MGPSRLETHNPGQWQHYHPADLVREQIAALPAVAITLQTDDLWCATALKVLPPAGAPAPSGIRRMLLWRNAPTPISSTSDEMREPGLKPVSCPLRHLQNNLRAAATPAAARLVPMPIIGPLPRALPA